MAKSFTDQKISSIIESTSRVHKSVDSKNLGAVPDNTNSTFEPIFVYDDNKNFKGLLSVYSSLYKVHLPPTSKASHALINPPNLTKNSKGLDVIKDMLSLKLHTLPVFDEKKKIKGIIRAKKLLKNIVKNQNALKEIAENLELHRQEVIDINSKVNAAYKKLRPNGTFQLIAIDKDGKLEGVVTRDKLKAAFTKPSQRQRFSKPFGGSGQAMFDEEEIKRSDLPLRKFVNIDIDKIDFKKDKTLIIKKVINSQKNSVVIIDSDNKPLGYISVRDILLAVWKSSVSEEIPIIMEKPKFVSPLVVDDIYIQITLMSEKLNKISSILRVEVSFKEGKVGIGRPTLIETTLNMKFYSGEDFVVKTKDWNILKGVNEALNRIYKKVRRASGKKKEHKAKSLNEASIEYTSI